MSEDTENEIVDRGDVVEPEAVEQKDSQEQAPVTDSLDESAETPEERAEREAAEAEEAKKRNIRIPKSRFDEAQAKARAREQALLEEIQRLKGGQQTSEAHANIVDTRKRIDDLQDKYEDLILDGMKDEARKVRKQIDAMRDELIEYQTSAKSEAAQKAALDSMAYNTQLSTLEEQYPALNPDHADFDSERTDEVAFLLNAFVKSGTSPSAALNKAVRYVFGEPADKRVSSAAQTLAQERARMAREKAADANGRQPSSTTRVGVDSDKLGAKNDTGIDIMRMSQEKFAKIDEETKARLRGDEL